MTDPYGEAVEQLSRFVPQLCTVSSQTREEVWEVRLYADRPIVLLGAFGWCFLKETGGETFERDKAAMLSGVLLSRVFSSLCEYSLYSYENELRQGYITLKGGHRVGIGSRAVSRGEGVTAIRQVSSLCLRVAREKKGCAQALFTQIPWQKGFLLAGAPGSGKTTFLRDIARMIGDQMIPCAVVDERSEICGGKDSGLDLGFCTDVLVGYSKKEGILTALRSLAPRAILCDEVGSGEDAEAVREGVCAGAAMIATVHAGDAEELIRRRQGELLLKTGAFAHVIFLNGREKGKVEQICKAEELFYDKGNWSAFNSGRIYGDRHPQGNLHGGKNLHA